MAGFKSKKIFCMGISKLSGKPCKAKGFPTNSFNKYGIQIFKCRYHGSQNCNWYGFRDRANRGGYNKPGYSDDKKIKSLASLKQFRDKPIENCPMEFVNLQTMVQKLLRKTAKQSSLS